MDITEEYKYISPDNDDNAIEYILDHRCTDGIEYLVRYKDPKYIYDQWVKAYNIYCYNRVLEYHDGKVPKNIVKRLKPESAKNENNDKFIIYGTELVNGEVMLKVHIPGENGIVTKNPKDLADKYMSEIIEYYESNCIEK